MNPPRQTPAHRLQSNRRPVRSKSPHRVSAQRPHHHSREKIELHIFEHWSVHRAKTPALRATPKIIRHRYRRAFGGRGTLHDDAQPDAESAAAGNPRDKQGNDERLRLAAGDRAWCGAWREARKKRSVFDKIPQLICTYPRVTVQRVSSTPPMIGR